MNNEMIEFMKFYELFKEMKKSSDEKSVNLEEMAKNFLSQDFYEENRGSNDKVDKNTRVKIEGASFERKIGRGKAAATGNKTVKKSEDKTEGASKSYKKNYKATRVISESEYINISNLCKKGFTYTDKKDGKAKRFRPNERLAFALALQATVGLRASDIVKITFMDMQKGKFSLQEKKTNKWQHRDINKNLCEKAMSFALENKITLDEKVYPYSVRSMQAAIQIISDYLGLVNVSTHSFRKLFAHTVYEKSGHNLELVRHLLNHEDIRTTMRYLGVSQKEIEKITEEVDYSFVL